MLNTLHISVMPYHTAESVREIYMTAPTTFKPL